MTNLDELKLTEADLHSVLWRKLQPHLEARLAQLRSKNDNELDATRTAHVRGAIAEVKSLLALGEQE